MRAESVTTVRGSIVGSSSVAARNFCASLERTSGFIATASRRIAKTAELESGGAFAASAEPLASSTPQAKRIDFIS